MRGSTVWSLKYLGKGSFCGSGQSILKIISLNTLVDVISTKSTYFR